MRQREKIQEMLRVTVARQIPGAAGGQFRRHRLRFLFLVSLLAGMVFTSPVLAASEEKSVSGLGVEMAEKYSRRRPVLWGEHLPGIVDSLASLSAPGGGCKDAPSRTVALTLDACDEHTDRHIIALLREHNVPATIFATNIWLRHNKAVAEDLAADPLFVFACHGKRHRPASVNGRQAYGITGTRSIPALVEEVEDNARAITAVTGVRPRWYRSGTAHYDDVALDIIRELGLAVAGYAVSADLGATLPAREVSRLLLAAPDGAVILCHMNHPESGTFRGLALAVPVLLRQGVRFVHLDGDTFERVQTEIGAPTRTPPEGAGFAADVLPYPIGKD